MENLLATPAVAFLIILLCLVVVLRLLSLIAYRAKTQTSESGTPYACGESSYDPLAQPDYSMFFPFAFFFTIAHVATLVLVSVPMGAPGMLIIALLYLLAVVAGLFILLGGK